MEQVLQACGVAALYFGNALIMYALGWLLTEVFALPWKFKPFNCRECLTFWLTAVGGVVLAMLVPRHLSVCQDGRVLLSTGLTGVSVLLGLTNFLYVKSKIQIYE